MSNRIIYFEIPSDNTERSKKFFGDIFGWSFEKFGESDYWMVKTGDPKLPGIDGAIMKKIHPDQPLVNSIQVENIDDVISKIRSAGGEIVLPKMAVDMVGWVAYFKDPDGYVHGIAQVDHSVKAGDDALIIERIFQAPPQRVWQAWTDPELVKKWWGPKDFTAPFVQIDLRVGGKYLNCMRSSEGKDYWGTGVYREIVPYERISVVDSFADEQGNPVPASYYGMGDDELPERMIVTAIFEEQNGNTRFTLRHQGEVDEKMREEMRQGWNESFDKLANIL